jgi:bifunctional non-homologous end joining protein LigD
MQKDKLVYKGRVGSFQGQSLSQLAPLIEARARKTSPFYKLPAEVKRDARFVRPDLVAEIEFAEFTADGHVRHGVFKGLREDKDAAEVVMEGTGKRAMAEHEARNVIAGVKLTHPERVMFEEQGVTKADLAAHYERVAARLMPHIENRLISLVRCPAGRSGQCFFQRHESRGFPDELKRKEIEESSGGKDNYLYVTALSGVVAAVQMGTLEFHIWGSRIDRLDHPDRLVFDLDPDEGLGFEDVKQAAFDLRDRLAKIGLQTVPLLTGGKGVHVIAPLERRREWEDVKAFARGFAELVAGDNPQRYLAQASKAKRKGRIFIDWLRNERGATAIAPYSTRARKGGPVATPVSWAELADIARASAFGIGDMAARLETADPWSETGQWRQSITSAMLAEVGVDEG